MQLEVHIFDFIAANMGTDWGSIVLYRDTGANLFTAASLEKRYVNRADAT